MPNSRTTYGWETDAARATSSVVVPTYPLAPKTAIAASTICSRRSSELIRRVASATTSLISLRVVLTLDMLSVDYYSVSSLSNHSITTLPKGVLVTLTPPPRDATPALRAGRRRGIRPDVHGDARQPRDDQRASGAARATRRDGGGAAVVRQRVHALVREHDPRRLGARRPIRPADRLHDRHRDLRASDRSSQR